MAWAGYISTRKAPIFLNRKNILIWRSLSDELDNFSQLSPLTSLVINNGFLLDD